MQTGDGFILAGFVVLVVAVFGPRQVWQPFSPTKCRNPECHRLTGTYFIVQRFLWIVVGLFVLLFGCQTREEAAQNLPQRSAPAEERLTDGVGAGGLGG